MLDADSLRRITVTSRFAEMKLTWCNFGEIHISFAETGHGRTVGRGLSGELFRYIVDASRQINDGME